MNWGKFSVLSLWVYWKLSTYWLILTLTLSKSNTNRIQQSIFLFPFTAPTSLSRIAFSCFTDPVTNNKLWMEDQLPHTESWLIAWDHSDPGQGNNGPLRPQRQCTLFTPGPALSPFDFLIMVICKINHILCWTLMFWKSDVSKNVGCALSNICGWWLIRMSPRIFFYPVICSRVQRCCWEGFQFSVFCKHGWHHSAAIPFFLSLPFCIRVPLGSPLCPLIGSIKPTWFLFWQLMSCASPCSHSQAPHDLWHTRVLIWGF